MREPVNCQSSLRSQCLPWPIPVQANKPSGPYGGPDEKLSLQLKKQKQELKNLNVMCIKNIDKIKGHRS